MCVCVCVCVCVLFKGDLVWLFVRGHGVCVRREGCVCVCVCVCDGLFFVCLYFYLVVMVVCRGGLCECILQFSVATLFSKVWLI